MRPAALMDIKRVQVRGADHLIAHMDVQQRRGAIVERLFDATDLHRTTRVSIGCIVPVARRTRALFFVTMIPARNADLLAYRGKSSDGCARNKEPVPADIPNRNYNGTLLTVDQRLNSVT